MRVSLKAPYDNNGTATLHGGDDYIQLSPPCVSDSAHSPSC